MSAEPNVIAPDGSRAFEFAEKFFEPLLRQLGLTVDQIEVQSLDELEESLQRVNDEIGHPESFGTAKLPQGSVKFWVLEATSLDVQVGILPILLDRKSKILRRIATLRPQAQLDELRQVLVKGVQDPEAKQSVADEIDIRINQIIEQAKSLNSQADYVQEQQRQARLLDIEVRERKSAIYKSFLERESVASIVGAFLLLALGVSTIVAMFTHTEASEVVKNSFLLILGYFFGQAVVERTSGSRAEPPAEGGP